MNDELTDLERSILDIERGWWRVAPTREQAIQRELGMTASKYYFLLSRMLDSPRVWAADPALVERLRRLRDARLAERGLDNPPIARSVRGPDGPGEPEGEVEVPQDELEPGREPKHIGGSQFGADSL